MAPTVSYIGRSDSIDKKRLNVICTGPDNGKVWYITKKIFMDFPEYNPRDVLLIQSHLSVFHNEQPQDLIPRQTDMLEDIQNSGINVMTYKSLYSALLKLDHTALSVLKSAKVILFDEFHTLYLRNHVYINYALLSKSIFNKHPCPSAELFIAFTSSPQIILAQNTDIGIEINWLNRYPVIRHKAQDIICTKMNVIPKMLETDLHGKTLILCLSARDCVKLHKQIPNSAVLISKRGSCTILQYTPEMERIKKHIVKYHTLPESTITRGLEHPIDVLITTHIPSEGMYFIPESNIKNVISCVGSDFFVSQISNRLTYDYDCLVVSDSNYNKMIFNGENYITCSNNSFRYFVEYAIDDDGWLDTVLPFASCKKIDVDIMDNPMRILDFRGYINSKWLCRQDDSEDVLLAKRLWKDQDKQEFVKMFTKYHMDAFIKKKPVTFNTAIKEITSIGYTVKVGNTEYGGGKRAFYQIYVKPRKPLFVKLVESQINPETMQWETVGVTNVPVISEYI